MENFLAHEQYRGILYQLLSEAYKLPKEGSNEKQVLEQLFQLLPLVSKETKEMIGEMIAEIDQKEGFEKVRRDHLKLFVGPKTLLAPPYGSLYLEKQGQIMGPSTQDAIRFYQAAGLKKSEDFKEPPDHIRTELEFMSYLITEVVKDLSEMEEKADCEKKKILTKCENFLELQEKFLKNHLGSWVRPFTQNLMKNGDTVFYQNLGKITEEFIRYEVMENLQQVKKEFKEIRQ